MKEMPKNEQKSLQPNELAGRVKEDLGKKYPGINIKYKRKQETPNGKSYFMIDIWFPPLIEHEKRTTIYVEENTTEKELTDKVIRKIAEYIIAEVVKKLEKKYPGVKISFKNIGMANLFYFSINNPMNFSSPLEDIIENDEETSVGIQNLTVKDLEDAAREILEQYKNAAEK